MNSSDTNIAFEAISIILLSNSGKNTPIKMNEYGRTTTSLWEYHQIFIHPYYSVPDLVTDL